jgi:transposase
VLSKNTNDRMEVPTIMRALEPEVLDTVWAAIEPLLPVRPKTHPLGCHRRRLPDKDCFVVMLVRLVTGCSWEDAERLYGNSVSDTTARARRDEWIEAGVFQAVADEAICAYDKVVGLDLTEVELDGSQHKSPAGGREPARTRRIGPSSAGSGRCSPTETAFHCRGRPAAPTATTASCSSPPSTVHSATDLRPASRPSGSTAATTTRSSAPPWPPLGSPMPSSQRNARKERQSKKGTAKTATKVPMGLRWPVERTNFSWLSNFGALRRNTDRTTRHRLAQLALAVVFLITAKLSTGATGGHRDVSLSAEVLRKPGTQFIV